MKNATKKQVAAAFTEWEKRYRLNPEEFWSDSKRLAASPKTYGEACAPYFLEILGEIQAS
jgi:hypothetical protein